MGQWQCVYKCGAGFEDDDQESGNVITNNSQGIMSRAPLILPGPKKLGYETIETAAANFTNTIGIGNFGYVYRGTLPDVDQEVAIKLLNEQAGDNSIDLIQTAYVGFCVKHPNIVRVLAYYIESNHRMLVYDCFSPHTTLASHLHECTPEMQPLDWATRMKIAHEVAKALDYLHHHPMRNAIVYKDLTSSKILLGEGYKLKLSGFGYSGNKSLHKCFKGYRAPELRGERPTKPTYKSDVYSFGVVLLELLTGQIAYDKTRLHPHRLLVDYVKFNFRNPSEIRDPRLRSQVSLSVFQKALELALICTHKLSSKRPSIEVVVSEMGYLAEQGSSSPNAPDPSAKGKNIVQEWW